MMLEELNNRTHKIESRHRPHTLHKNEFKMDHRCQYKTHKKTMKCLEDNITENLGKLGQGQ